MIGQKKGVVALGADVNSNKRLRPREKVQGSRRDQKSKRSQRREVELDLQVSPEEFMSREVELG